MFTFLMHRVLVMIPTLLVISVITFLMRLYGCLQTRIDCAVKLIW